MKLTEYSVNHKVTTIMIFVALTTFGVISLSRLGLELFPDITYPTVAVVTIDTGVSPYEVETNISKPIEDAVSSINGVENVSSTSSEGISFVTVNFIWGTNMSTIVPEIREKLTDVEADLPDDAERPMIFRYNPEVLPSITFVVESDIEGLDLRRLAEKRIVPEIEKVKGVAAADIYGGKKQAVTCKLNVEDLSKLNISITQVLKAFQGENINIPAGSININNKYLVIRTIGKFSQLKDIGNVLIGYRGKIPVLLKDISSIELGDLPQEEFVLSSARNTIEIQIRKQPGHNTVDVIEQVKNTVNSIKKSLPPSVRIRIQSDQSKSIIMSIGGVASAAWQGGLLAILVLLFFLRNVSSTLIISVAIPVSIVTTFSLMDFGHITMNIMSLAGITLGIGMLVDNSIVVLESIYRKQLSSLPPKEAAVQGTEEVSRAITASTLTTVAVFLPLVFVKGITGLIFKDLAFTISFALSVSLAMALTLMPVLCSNFLKVPKLTINKKPLNDSSSGYRELSLADVDIHTGNRAVDAVSKRIRIWLVNLDTFYEAALQWALDHSSAVIITAIVLLFLSIGSIALMGMEFLPDTDEGKFSITLETGIGSPYSRTSEKVRQADKLITDTLGTDLASLASSVGRGGDLSGISETGSHLAFISVLLVDKDKRTKSVWQIINLLSKKLRENIVDVKFTFQIQGMSSLASSASGAMEPIVLEISGDNLDSDYEYALQISKLIKNIPGARDVKIGYRTGKPELQFKINRQRAVSLGLSPLEIAASLRTVFKGTTVSKFKQGEDSYDIVVTVNKQDKNSFSKITNLFFINPAGNKIPLENVADIRTAAGPVSIHRKNRTRMIKVSASLTGERALNRVVGDIKKTIYSSAPPPPGIKLNFTGSSKQMKESFHSLILALLLAVALVYMVMASQFESFLHPFIVMFSVPFSIVGLVAALLLTNTTFSMVAFIGAIVLVGIVVNNAIVLIDYMNLLRRRGVSLRDAIIHGGKTRLKPILMTSLTTVLGLLPMALGLGTGAELRAPMARAVVGGLTTSTLITLILIPTIYWLVESRLKRRN